MQQISLFASRQDARVAWEGCAPARPALHVSRLLSAASAKRALVLPEPRPLLIDFRVVYLHWTRIAGSRGSASLPSDLRIARERVPTIRPAPPDRAGARPFRPDRLRARCDQASAPTNLPIHPWSPLCAPIHSQYKNQILGQKPLH